jgi:hypothetical protein
MRLIVPLPVLTLEPLVAAKKVKTGAEEGTYQLCILVLLEMAVG